MSGDSAPGVTGFSTAAGKVVGNSAAATVSVNVNAPTGEAFALWMEEPITPGGSAGGATAAGVSGGIGIGARSVGGATGGRSPGVGSVSLGSSLNGSGLASPGTTLMTGQLGRITPSASGAGSGAGLLC